MAVSHFIRTQFAYYRALFDIPHMVGCPSIIKYYHTTLARRCVGVDSNLYTLGESQDSNIAKLFDPIDPLQHTSQKFY